MVGTQTSNVGNSGSGSDWSIYSEFARLNYNYDERYLFEANLRNDASSKFAKGNRSALFPSFSLGWRISEEKFFEKLKEHISSLKLRTSWGLVGNNRIDNYQYLSSVTVSPKYNFVGFENTKFPNILAFLLPCSYDFSFFVSLQFSFLLSYGILLSLL